MNKNTFLLCFEEIAFFYKLYSSNSKYQIWEHIFICCVSDELNSYGMMTLNEACLRGIQIVDFL